MASRPEDEAVVISNGEDLYVWRPENQEDLDKVFGSNKITDRIKSFLKPVSSKMNFFDIKLQGYLPEKEDSLWINPQGAAMYIERGKIGKLRSSIPAQLRSDEGLIGTEIQFRYELTQPGTVNSVICSDRKSERKAKLVEDNVTVDLQKEIFEEQAEVGRNPLDY